MPLKLSDHQIGIISGILSALAFALMATSVQKVSTDIPIQEISFTRGLISFLFLIPMNLKHIPLIFDTKAKYVWFRSMAGASAVICYFWNTSQGSAAEAKALGNISPLFVAIFSYLFYNERLSKKEFIGLSILITGAILLVVHIQGTQGNMVYLIGLLGSFFAGIAYLSLKQASANFSKTLIVLVFSFCVMIVSFLTPSKSWIMPHGIDLFWLLSVGIFGLLGQVLLTLSHLKLKNAVASSLTLLTLIFLILHEVIFLEVKLPEQSILSYLGIIFGMLMMVWSKQKN